MNDMVYVRFTDLGYDWLAQEHNTLAHYITNWEIKTANDFKKEADAGGYTEMVFWEFMNKIGPKSSMGVLDRYMDINILMKKEVFNQQEQ